MGLADKPPNVRLDPSPDHPPPSEHSPAASPSANPSPTFRRPASATGRGVGIVPLPKFPSRLDRTPGDASGASRHLNRTHSAPPQELAETRVAQPLESPTAPSLRSPSSSSAGLKPPPGAAFRPRKEKGSMRPQRTSSGGNAVMRMAKIAEDLDSGNATRCSSAPIAPSSPDASAPVAAPPSSSAHPAALPAPLHNGALPAGADRRGGGGREAGKERGEGEEEGEETGSPPRMDVLLRRFEEGTQQLGILLWGNEFSPLADMHPPSPPPKAATPAAPSPKQRSPVFPSSSSVASPPPKSLLPAADTSGTRTAIRLRFAGDRAREGAGLLFPGRASRRTLSSSSDASSCSLLTTVSVSSAPLVHSSPSAPVLESPSGERAPGGPRHTHTGSRASIANSLFDDPMLDAIYADEDGIEDDADEGDEGERSEEGWVTRGDSIAESRTSSIHLGSGRLGSMRYGEGAEEEWGGEVEREAIKMRALVKQIADRGGLEDCLASYAGMRMEVVRQAVKDANVRLAVSAGALEGQAWGAVEPMFKTWLSQAHALALVLVQRERALLAAIFKDIPSFALSAPPGPARPTLARLPSLAAKLPTPTALLADIVVEAGLLTALFHLRASATALLHTAPAPEKIFVLLDMYWLLRSTVDNMNEVAPASLSDAWGALPGRAAGAATRSLEELHCMLEQGAKPPPSTPKKSLGSRLRLPRPGRKKAQGAAAGEGAPSSVAVHPVTSYVVNYLRQFQDRSHAGSYGCILEEALREFEAGASVEHETGRLLEGVRANMEVKGLACPSDLMRAIFLINNLHYLASFAEKQQHPCAASLHAALEKHCDTFESLALKRILDALGPGDSSSIDDNEVIKRLRVFNVAFEELALEQKDWSFTNDECRRNMRQRLSSTVRTTYAKFLLPHREDLCTMPTYHWAPDGVERLMQKSFLFNSSLLPFASSV
ncbi:hypothetical protein CLOM_g19469 [Closterium sp. NIES-68]|nr:hypothetical protein CLOM_g19469 [Closterium sp. NIES-68]GJP68971.1 hypothetical protein CLOP_g25605 [Closterium sp. NIES-67]